MPVLGPPMGHHQMPGYPHPQHYGGGPPPHSGYPPPPPMGYPNMQTPVPQQQQQQLPPPPPQVSDHVESAKKRQDYEALCHIINQWNANRLDLFALSLPNEVGTTTFYYYSICLA